MEQLKSKRFIKFLVLFFISAPGTISCQIDSENRDECIKEAIQDMLPKLVVSEIKIQSTVEV